MIKNFDKKLNWEVLNFKIIIIIISPRQLEVSDPTGRLQKVNVSDIHKILPSDLILSSIPDEQILTEEEGI